MEHDALEMKNWLSRRNRGQRGGKVKSRENFFEKLDSPSEKVFHSSSAIINFPFHDEIDTGT